MALNKYQFHIIAKPRDTLDRGFNVSVLIARWNHDRYRSRAAAPGGQVHGDGDPTRSEGDPEASPAIPP
jgi:hypothetical protein